MSENQEKINPLEKSGPGDSGLNPGAERIKENLKRGPGRPAGTGKSSQPAAVSGEQKAALDRLYKPELWSKVAALPFNFRRIMTGSEIFALDKEQETTLGLSLSALMQSFQIVNPQYVALTILIANMGTIFTEKEILYRLSQPQKEKTDKEK